jgi:small-conductance mechanosensitive channel
MRTRSSAAMVLARAILVLALPILGFALSAAAPPPASAQPPARPAGDTLAKNPYGDLIAPVPAAEAAELRLANRPIATFRAQVLGRSPAERAAAAAALIGKALDRDPRANVDAQPIPDGVVVQLAGKPVFTLTTWDVDPGSGETVAEAAAAAVERLRLAVAEYREQRSPRRIAFGVARVLLLTAIAYLLTRGVMALRRWLHRMISTLIKSRMVRTQQAHPDTHAPTAAVVTESYLAVGIGRLVDVLSLAALLVIAYMWVTGSLRSFPYTRPWGETLREHLLSVLSSTLLAFVHALPGLLAVGVIFIVTRYITRLVNLVLTGVEEEKIAMPLIDPEIAAPTRRILSASLWIFALLIAYPFLPGSGTDAFKGVSFFVGLMVSLGSSSVVNQAMSGFVLMYSRALKPGDFVRIGATEGVVTSLGLLSTKVRTRHREEVSIPNAVVLSDTTKNYSRYGGRFGLMLSTTVSIGYTAPWRQVHAMLKRAAAATPGLLTDPPPLVRQTELGSFGVAYEVSARLENPEERIATLAQLHANIQDEFNRHSVQIMVPAYESDPPAPAVVPPEKWHASPATPEEGGKL